MVQINFALKEVSCKIVYYGPGLSGKTTNLQMVHEKMPSDRKSTMTSIATEGERTLFFDFLPLDLGTVAGMRTKFQLYTVPGQVYYNATRKLVLKGVDGVVFVADSQPCKMVENLQSWQNLQENLAEHGLTLDEVPVVFQFNKRDVPDAVPVDLMNDRLNAIGAPTTEAVACRGDGVIATLRQIAGLVLDRLNQHHDAAPAATHDVPGGTALSTGTAPQTAGATGGVQPACKTHGLPATRGTPLQGRAAPPEHPGRGAPAAPASARPAVPRPAPVPLPFAERIGSGLPEAVKTHHPHAWVGVAAGGLVALAAAAVAYFVWFRP